MAPFGRNFLKARLKSRSKESKEEVVGKEVQVCVCEEEKVVCGVTKHTTCADLVQALLEDHRSLPESRRSLALAGEPSEFCLLERWRGFERALPPLTRILRLYNAWGEQKPNVRFLLVKASEWAPPTTKPGAAGGKRGACRSRSAVGGGVGGGAGARARRWEQCPAQYAKTLPAERQKRLVKKAFRKLEKLQKQNQAPNTTAAHSSSSSGSPVGRQLRESQATRQPTSTEGSPEVQSLVQLLISQDVTIRQQLQRMQHLDIQIELQERMMRTQQQGLDSAGDVPEATRPAGAGPSCDSSPCRLSLTDSCESQWQDYLGTSDQSLQGLEQLEEQLRRHQELIEELSQDIDTEMQKAHWLSQDDVAELCTADWLAGGEEDLGASAAEAPLDLAVARPLDVGRPGALRPTGSTSLGLAGSASLGPAGSTSLGPAGSTSVGPAGSTSLGPAGSASLGLVPPDLWRVRAELERSMCAGLQLYSQTQELQRDLQHHDASLLLKGQEWQLLAAQLSALQLGDSSPQPGPSTPLKSQNQATSGSSNGLSSPLKSLAKANASSSSSILAKAASANSNGLSSQQKTQSQATSGSSIGVEQKGSRAGVRGDSETRRPWTGLGLTVGLTGDSLDTDSDTGISSTHSQDSLSPSVNRRPTLDTDV